MTQSEIETLSRQADRAAKRVSAWPAWQRDLAARVAGQPGTDVEPRVNVVVVRIVGQALQRDRAEDESSESPA